MIVGGAASDTAQRPLDQCDCFDRLRPPSPAGGRCDLRMLAQGAARWLSLLHSENL